MARRKKKGNSRKRPLIFTESPVEASRRYPSPVFSARNPVGAEVVPVKEKLQTWVSPQIDPNAPYTPPRRHQRRCRTACSLDPTQTQRREITRKESAAHYTSLQFIKKAADKRGKIANGGEISSCESSDSSITLTEYDLRSSSSYNHLGLSKESKSAEKRRPKVGEHGRTRAQRRRSRSESIHQTGKNPPLTNKNVDIPVEANSIRTGHKENSRRKFNNPGYQTKEVSSDDINEDSDSFPSTDKNVINSKRVLRTRFEVGNTQATDSAKRKSTLNKKCSSFQFTVPTDSSSTDNSCRRRSARRKLNASVSGNLDQGRKKSCWPKNNKSTSNGRVLAYDTPEADYGVAVSLRRRRNLLPTPAKNKLMIGL